MKSDEKKGQKSAYMSYIVHKILKCILYFHFASDSIQHHVASLASVAFVSFQHVTYEFMMAWKRRKVELPSAPHF